MNKLSPERRAQVIRALVEYRGACGSAGNPRSCGFKL